MDVLQLLSVIVLLQIDLFTIISKRNYFFISWVIACISNVPMFLSRLWRLASVKLVVRILNSAMNTVYPFMFVVIMFYSVFAFVGMALYGGKINSTLPEKYLNATDSQLLRNYQFLNWNDFLNSLTCLYTIQVGNQTPILINMGAIARNPEERDYSGLFFLVVIIANDMILFNLFVGSVISICLDAFERQKTEELDIIDDESRLSN